MDKAWTSAKHLPTPCPHSPPSRPPPHRFNNNDSSQRQLHRHRNLPGLFRHPRQSVDGIVRSNTVRFQRNKVTNNRRSCPRGSLPTASRCAAPGAGPRTGGELAIARKSRTAATPSPPRPRRTARWCMRCARGRSRMVVLRPGRGAGHSGGPAPRGHSSLDPRIVRPRHLDNAVSKRCAEEPRRVAVGEIDVVQHPAEVAVPLLGR